MNLLLDTHVALWAITDSPKRAAIVSQNVGVAGAARPCSPRPRQTVLRALRLPGVAAASDDANTVPERCACSDVTLPLIPKAFLTWQKEANPPAGGIGFPRRNGRSRWNALVALSASSTRICKALPAPSSPCSSKTV